MAQDEMKFTQVYTYILDVLRSRMTFISSSTINLLKPIILPLA
jgi:hypothetical protein